MDPLPNGSNNTNVEAIVTRAAEILAEIQRAEQFTTVDQWHGVVVNLRQLTSKLNVESNIVNDALTYLREVETEFNNKRTSLLSAEQRLKLIQKEIDDVRPLIRGPVSLLTSECSELRVSLDALREKLGNVSTDGNNDLSQLKNEIEEGLAKLEADLRFMASRARIAKVAHLQAIMRKVEDIRPRIRGPASLTPSECVDLGVELLEMQDKLAGTSTEGDNVLRVMKASIQNEVVKLGDDLDCLAARARS